MKKNMFELPEIETNATKKAVEEALERYRMLLLQTPEESIPKLTATYSFIPPSTNKEYISTTEAMAVQKADFEAMREKYLTKIQKAVNRLKPRERALIVNKYMLQEDKYDYEVYNSIGLSERTYYRYKARAFYSLALSLGIEVYKEDVQTA